MVTHLRGRTQGRGGYAHVFCFFHHSKNKACSAEMVQKNVCSHHTLKIFLQGEKNSCLVLKMKKKLRVYLSLAYETKFKKN